MNAPSKVILIAGLTAMLSSSCQTEPWQVDNLDFPSDKLHIVHFADSVLGLDSITMMAQLNHMAPNHPLLFEAEWESNFPPYLLSETVQSLYQDVIKSRPALADWDADLHEAFARLTHWTGPIRGTTYVYTWVSQAENHAILIGDGVVFLPWDQYLGAEHPLYDKEERYLASRHHPDMAMAQIVAQWASAFLPSQANGTDLINAMLHEGRYLMVLHAVLGEDAAYRWLGVGPEQRTFLENHERDIWSTFMQERWLYNSSPDLKRKLIQPAPFSKLGSTMDGEIPGQVGSWLGCRILQSHWREHADLSLIAITQSVDDNQLLQQSAYRP